MEVHSEPVIECRMVDQLLHLSGNGRVCSDTVPYSVPEQWRLVYPVVFIIPYIRPSFDILEPEKKT